MKLITHCIFNVATASCYSIILNSSNFTIFYGTSWGVKIPILVIFSVSLLFPIVMSLPECFYPLFFLCSHIVPLNLVSRKEEKSKTPLRITQSEYNRKLACGFNFFFSVVHIKLLSEFSLLRKSPIVK